MNPYQPRAPADPESFAGRSELLGAVQEALRGALRWHRGSALLLHGYRGSGKTSALRKIADMVRQQEPAVPVVEVQPRVATSENALFTMLVEETQRAALDRPGSREKVKASLRRVAGVNILGTGVSLSERRRVAPIEPLVGWRETLGSIHDAPAVLVEIDDAESLAASGLVALKIIAEMQSPVPILLVVAGGPELLDRMTEARHSPVLRNFSGAIFDIGRLSMEETGQALTAPLKGSGSSSSWTTGAVERVHQLSRGYPYLIQCLAHAAFRDGATLSAEEVEAAVPRALALAAGWIEREVPAASRQDVRCFVQIADLGNPRFTTSEAVRAGVPTVYLGRLCRLGVLRRLSRGRYELVRSPVIAYYLALSRGAT